VRQTKPAHHRRSIRPIVLRRSVSTIDFSWPGST